MEKMTISWVMEYADTNGNQSAIALLLLGGIEEFDGTIQEYNELIQKLEKDN